VSDNSVRTTAILPAEMLTRLREIAARDAAHGGRINASAVIVRAVNEMFQRMEGSGQMKANRLVLVPNNRFDDYERIKVETGFRPLREDEDTYGIIVTVRGDQEFRQLTGSCGATELS
jgi:hypothetical protein